MAGGNDRQDPSAPGWYPDPWSATGDGERYFDGKRWGSNEKPLARHTVATIEPGVEPKAERRRRVVLPVAILVVLVLAVWGLPKLLNGSSEDSSSAPTGSRATAGPPPGAEETSKPLGTPAAVPAGTGQFQYGEHQPGSAKPVAFDPCRPIHYVVNPSGAPADGLALIQDAVGKLSVATGLKFVYDGPTNEAPDKHREPYLPYRYDRNRWAPVLIAWADEASYQELAGYIAGETSPVSVSAPNGHLVYVSGQIVLDDRDLSTATTPDRAEAEATVLHELGHLAGLDHTSDKTQLMYSEGQPGVQAYGDGDLRGLASLGRQACFPDV